MIPNYYEILNLTTNASKNEIKKAYRKLALDWHPDRNSSPDAHEKFIEINQAYLILSDDEARLKYDIEYNSYFKGKDVKETSIFENDEINDKDEKSQFQDEDLKGWSRNAKEQAETYASMSFDEFMTLIKDVVKEAGIQGVTALIFAISGVVSASSIFSLIYGIINGEMSKIVTSILFLMLSIFGFSFASKRYE